MASEAPGYLGPYRLLNVVHTGQTSQIWQAYHDGKQLRFAVKTLLQKFNRDREHMRYLRWEYAVAEKLSHDRVVQISELGSDRGTPYLAMEWFPAPNMKNRVQHKTDKITFLVPKIIEQAAEGLAYFNEQGWVHRDIKPDNFLVTDDGEVKLIDFALARRSTRGLTRLLAPKAAVQGTRSYMAPEQIRGAAVDQRADVYGFGCTVFELVSGKPPYTGASADELLMKHLRAPLPSLEAAAKNVAPEFARLVRRCLAKNPAERPQSIRDFLVEFHMNPVFKSPPRPPQDV
ncbi:MAG: serine/threonine protein kinase [Planctomycetota bacterium]